MAYTLALRPSAPALSRPQRVLLRIEGEQIADAEYRPDVGDKIPFARIERMDMDQLAAATGAACRRCGTAHAIAFCQAVEDLAAIVIPQRAAALRLIAAELERASSHLATVEAIFAALGLPATAGAFAAESQAVGRALLELAGEPAAAWLRPGGVARDPGAETLRTLDQNVAECLERLFAVADKTIGRRTLLACTVEVGTISTGAAEQFGLAGPLARAAGLQGDLRIDTPYGAYDVWRPELITQDGGDVYARLTVYLLEALESLKLTRRAAAELPTGAVRTAPPGALPGGSGEGAVEAPRGPLRYQVEADNGRLCAVSCRPAPQLDRLLARTALVKASLDDAALIIVSTDPCDTCLEMADR